MNKKVGIAMDPMAWRQTMGNFATGVTVITTIDELGHPLGMTANAFTSLSLDPPMVLICVDNNSTTLPQIQQCNKYCVNILSQDQEEVSRQFAKKGGSEKFDGVSYYYGDIGLPVIENSLTSVECEISAILDGGDHKILLGRGIKIHQFTQESKPLVFYRGKYQSLGIVEEVN